MQFMRKTFLMEELCVDLNAWIYTKAKMEILRSHYFGSSLEYFVQHRNWNGPLMLPQQYPIHW